MNAFTILLGVLMGLVVVNARHFGDHENEDALAARREDDMVSSAARQRDNAMHRHRRRRWQMNYGYQYPQPAPYFPEERRDYDRQQDLLPQIYRLLDEISSYVKRPQYPPQPIYIPYPVPYPVPQRCRCKPAIKPNVTTRFPSMDDVNQNWGLFDSNENYEDDESDGSRPLSFKPIQPKRPVKNAPRVEHGSTQSGMDGRTQAPIFVASDSEQTSAPNPGVCNAAVLSCCRLSDDRVQQKNCFTNFGCGMTFSRGNSCGPEIIAAAIESFKSAYSPVN